MAPLSAMAFLACFLSTLTPSTALELPSLPLRTSSRWIVDANQSRVKFRCVNWAAHMEPSVPEGLQHASISDIADKITSLPFNCVRLTYSIDAALAPDIPVRESFQEGAQLAGVPEPELLALYDQAVTHNPFLANATRRSVLVETVRTLASRGLMVILDNHVSRPGWCCNLTDGNGWWSDARPYIADTSRYFDTARWLAGLEAMATWSASHANIVALGVRNEIRGFPLLQDGPDKSIWFDRIPRAIDAITASNPAALAVVGGTLGGTDFSFQRLSALDRSPWPDRVVWEYHVYSYSIGYATGNCDLFRTQMGAAAGYLLGQDKPYTGPLWVSEFGFGQVGGLPEYGGLSEQDGKYFECLREYLVGNDADWAVWALQGDYYVRDGQIGFDESYGLLSRDWKGWRNGGIGELLGDMFGVTQGP